MEILTQLERDVIGLARNAPRDGFQESQFYDVHHLHDKYNISNYYMTEVLESLKSRGYIRDYIVNYDRHDGHILSYRFR